MSLRSKASAITNISSRWKSPGLQWVFLSLKENTPYRSSHRDQHALVQTGRYHEGSKCQV